MTTADQTAGPYDYLPVIRLAPQASDAELAADRDRKHAAAVESWLEANPWAAAEGLEAATSLAFTRGWFAMAQVAHDILADLLTKNSYNADRLAESMGAFLGGQRVGLLVASERIARAASGRGDQS